MEAGDIIAQKHMEEYVNRCVVKFILSESKYGYIGSGISDVFERYYEMFNDNTWNLLFENFGIKVVQTWLGCIIAATVISFPLMYRNARAAMEQIDVNLIYAGRTLGMSDTEIFWKVVIPTAGPGIASGTILHLPEHSENMERHLCLPEIIPGKTGTISQKIAMVIQDGDYLTAGVWVAIVMAIAFGIVVLMNIIAGKKMKQVKRW